MLVNKIKNYTKKILRRMGYEIIYSPAAKNIFTGFDFKRDVKFFVKEEQPICFDVGANEGQTITLFQSIFDEPVIYSFEPAIKVFEFLSSKKTNKNIKIFNVALGNKSSQKKFINYSNNRLSSFLELDQGENQFFNQEKVTSCESVNVVTLDEFICQHAIPKIDILKIDTQGFDLNVLIGATSSFENGLIDNVLVELNFVGLYKNQSNPYDICSFLLKYNFQIVDYYEKVYKNHTLAWCNALFTRQQS